jgi:hypothetical protein
MLPGDDADVEFTQSIFLIDNDLVVAPDDRITPDMKPLDNEALTAAILGLQRGSATQEWEEEDLAPDDFQFPYRPAPGSSQ